MTTGVPTKLVETETRRIAIQGVDGAFHEIAAKKFFGEDIELEMCDSFPILFRSLNQGKAKFGVIAIENTVAGSLLPNYALLRDSNYTIIGEVFLRIEHQLMVLPGQKLEDIKAVHSHPMAIQQCQKFFEHYPDIKLVEAADTAGSAKWIRENKKKGRAAIASKLAAQHYDLEIIAESIETNKRNFTRFLIILDKDIAKDYPSYTPNKSSLSFSLAERSRQVGSLSQILIVLSSYGINLTKIQSLPVLGKEWEYFFHLDLEFDDYEHYSKSIDAIRPLISELTILGEYPRGEKYLNGNV